MQTGDEIEVDVAARRIHLHVGEEELARRRAAWRRRRRTYLRGYGAMYSEHIGQADEGCDFDFLAGTQRTPSRKFIDDKARPAPSCSDAKTSRRVLRGGRL